MNATHKIKAKRIGLGLTQGDLAQLVGCAQSTISMIESGNYPISDLMCARIARVLDKTEHSQPEERQLVLPFPKIVHLTTLPIEFSVWNRPDLSGDFYFIKPISENSLLVILGDVAGHGSSVFPYAVYLSGWLEGYLSKFSAPVRLDSTIKDINKITRMLNIGLSIFIAQISVIPQKKDIIKYEAVSCGFPPPLLLYDVPYKTLVSSHLNSPLPFLKDKDIIVVSHEISAPWKLAMCSDGLLDRLGAGMEQEGKSRLLEFISGFNREETLDSFLNSSFQPADDETLLISEWNRWDRKMLFNLDDHTTLDFFYTVMVNDLAKKMGIEDIEAISQATVEAVNNARKHAYLGKTGDVALSYRVGSDGVYIEIRDSGRGKVTQSQIHSSRGGFLLINQYADSVDVHSAADGGTVVTLTKKFKTE